MVSCVCHGLPLHDTCWEQFRAGAPIIVLLPLQCAPIYALTVQDTAGERAATAVLLLRSGRPCRRVLHALRHYADELAGKTWRRTPIPKPQPRTNRTLLLSLPLNGQLWRDPHADFGRNAVIQADSQIDHSIPYPLPGQALTGRTNSDAGVDRGHGRSSFFTAVDHTRPAQPAGTAYYTSATVVEAVPMVHPVVVPVKPQPQSSG